MSELPYTTGLTDEFTTLVPTSVSSSEWVNQKGTTNFVLQNAEFADDTITLAGSNIAYLPIAEPTEYTAYILCKTYFTPNSDYSSGRWGQIFGCRNGSNRCYVGISMYSSTPYQLRIYTSSTLKNPTMDNWHVITVKRTGGYYYVYADGELIISETNTATTRGDKFMIKSITDKGSTPTVDEAITVYLKYCAIFNTAQTDRQIQSNSNQILVDFGLKPPEKNSRLAGTDAVAIAYAIARNRESAAALQQIKKSYRDGVKQGVKDGADTHEDHTDPNTDPINIETDEDGNTKEPYIGDLAKGLYFTEAPTSSGGNGRYVHMWLDMSYVIDGNEIVRTGRLVYEAYDNEGNLIKKQTTTGSANRCWRNDWKYKNNYGYIYKVKIDGSTVTFYEVDFYESENFKPSYTVGVDWSPSGTVAEIMKNSTVRTTLPPLEG